MNRTVWGVSYILLVLASLLPGFGEADDDSETEHAVEYRYELASSPDAHMVYEDTYYFEVVSPQSLSYTYKLRQAKDFGTNFNRQYNKAKLVVADPVEACRPIVNKVESKVALVLRGGCSFITKSKHAESAGALAVIIADNDHDNDDHMIDMIDDETGRSIDIPAMFLMGKDGMMIRHHLVLQGLEEAVINIPVNLTGVAIGTAKQPPWTLW
ncbi:protease-associated domain-containing protein 1-like [Babylonia areolata]|uniref:protease-associated domain-containing protein 1-like n=1 Tax=Babylonia areolata TaxID=304850 RepID=UPI003FCFF191